VKMFTKSSHSLFKTLYQAVDKSHEELGGA
jgi:hypothetical protein